LPNWITHTKRHEGFYRAMLRRAQLCYSKSSIRLSVSTVCLSVRPSVKFW